MALSIAQRVAVAVAVVSIASGCWPLSQAAAAPATTDEQQNRSPSAGFGAGKQLASVTGMRLATELGEAPSGESRPTEKKSGATRRNGEALILILHILRGPK